MAGRHGVTPGRAWIRRLKLINWHGHENATLDVLGDMLAIIGENGSGKSLILDAIDWALFPAPNKQFNLAAREGGRTSRRTLSNTILFFDPHGVDRPDKGWRRQRTVGYCAAEIEHEGEGRWVYGSAAAATPNSSHPFYYALPGTFDSIHFLESTGKGQAPLQFTEFRARNESLVAQGGGFFNASQAEDYNRVVARRLLNIEGADWQRRYDALCDVLHRMLGLRVDDSLVADPSGVVREFLPIVDRPHLERLVEGLEGIQRIHRDIDEYAKLRAMLGGVVEARRKYHEAALHNASLAWLRTAWANDDAMRTLGDADVALRESEAVARQAEANEEAAYGEESAARRELESVQQLHKGDTVQAVARANEALATLQHEQDRAARDLRTAQDRLLRSEAQVMAARQALDSEHENARARLTEMRDRATQALGAMPDALGAAWSALIATPEDQAAADALHEAWSALDGQLGGFEAHAKRISDALAQVHAAQQAERDARSQHEAAARSVQTARQALWSRWDKMIQRWPEDMGRAPANEPSTMELPPLNQSAHSGMEAAENIMRESAAQAARLEVSTGDLEKRLAMLGEEIGAIQSEPRPELSPEREKAFTHLTQADPNATPIYRHLDLNREAMPWADAIEGLLEHLDLLTLLTTGASVDHVRAALGSAADWHVLLPNPSSGKAQRGSVAAALLTEHPDVRKHLDALLGMCILSRDPQRGSDFLCTDGRYRVGDHAGTVRPKKRSESLIGVVRRQAAAAARREELAAEQAALVKELERARAELRAARDTTTKAEARVRALADVTHMLDEIDQRRVEMRALREAEEAASVRLTAAGREVDAAGIEESDARARWTDLTAPFPGLREPDALPRARLMVAQSAADAVARASETRQRVVQVRARLRSAEDSHGAEAQAHEVAESQRALADQKVADAQRMLNEARQALRVAGLEGLEARITQLQRRLKEAEDRARQTGVAKGIALHQLDAAREDHKRHDQSAAQAAAQFAERSDAFGALLRAVADGLDLSASETEDPIRYARQLTKGRESRGRLDDELPRAYSAAEREQEGFLAAVGEFQAMVGTDDRFGLRQPVRLELALAPQGWLLNVAPRREGTSDVRLLLSHLNVTIEQLQQTLAQRVTRVVRDIILGEVVAHLSEQLRRAGEIITGLNERLANARFFSRNTRFSLKLSVRVTRHPDIPFDHVAVATAILEHGNAMPAGVQAQLTTIFATWLDDQMKGQTQPTVEALVEQLDYRRWVEISLLHSDDLDPRIRPWDSAVSGFGSGGEQRVPVYVLLLTAAAMQFAVSSAPLRLLMHDEAFARMDQRNADLVIRFAQQLGMGMVIASPNLDLFAEGVSYATAYRLRQLPNGYIAREALHLKAAPLPDAIEDPDEAESDLPHAVR